MYAPCPAFLGKLGSGLPPKGHSRQLKELNIIKYGESLVQNRM